MAVEMLVGAGPAVLLVGSNACPGCWFPLQPGSVSWVTALRPLLWHKYSRGPSAGQDVQGILALLEVLSASLSPPARHDRCGETEQPDSSGL